MYRYLALFGTVVNIYDKLYGSTESGGKKTCRHISLKGYIHRWVKVFRRQGETTEFTQDMLKNYYKLSVMCLLRIKESIDTWEKRFGADGYFDFLENYMGNQIKGSEMEFTIINPGFDDEAE